MLLRLSAVRVAHGVNDMIGKNIKYQPKRKNLAPREVTAERIERIDSHG